MDSKVERSDDVESINNERQRTSKLQRRHRHRQEVRKLKPFPAMYLSDNPYFTEQNLVILGLVSNAERRIDVILYQLESIGCLFNSTTLLIFESNSKDRTLLHLQSTLSFIVERTVSTLIGLWVAFNRWLQILSLYIQFRRIIKNQHVTTSQQCNNQSFQDATCPVLFLYIFSFSWS